MPVSQQPNRGKITGRATSRQRFKATAVFLVIVGVFAVFFAAANDKINISRFIDPCGFRQRYNLPCPTCGMTTSVLAFAQGRIVEAFYIQPAAAILCGLVAIIALWAFLTAVLGLNCSFINRFLAKYRIRYILLIILMVILAGWAVTLARAMAAAQH